MAHEERQHKTIHVDESKKKSYYTEHLENEKSRGVGKTSVLIRKKKS